MDSLLFLINADDYSLSPIRFQKPKHCISDNIHLLYLYKNCIPLCHIYIIRLGNIYYFHIRRDFHKGRFD